MKKFISSVMILALAMSFSACGAQISEPSDISTHNATQITENQELTAETTKETTTIAKPEVESEAASEETETTTAEIKVSERDKLMKELVEAYHENYDNEFHTYTYTDDNKLVLTQTNDLKGMILDLNTKQYVTLSDDEHTYIGDYSFVFRDMVGLAITNGGLQLMDFNNNMISEIRDGDMGFDFGNDYWYPTNDGCFVKYTDEKGLCKFSDKLELIDSLTEFELDVGHKKTMSACLKNIYRYLGSDTAIAEFETNNHISDTKLVNFTNLEASDMSESLSNSELNSRNGSIRVLTDGYSQYSSSLIYGEDYTYYDDFFCFPEVGKIDHFNDLFFTEKAMYFVNDHILYKYVSEDNIEIIYNENGLNTNCYYTGVGEDYFIVYDNVGVFLVDRATGEETELDIKLR